MKIAITADLHLTARDEHVERYHALENILSQMVEADIDRIIIAGDLFDGSFKNYSVFEAVCGQPKHKGITFYVIPGNHDQGLSGKALAADNVTVFDKPELITIDPDGPQFLFVPYEPGVSMGERIAAFSDSLEAGNWVLIGHGDYGEGQLEANPYEKGVYMPLTRNDSDRFNPAKVFLGHIHKIPGLERILYPGSPCGLDINETGKRSFIVYDTLTQATETHIVDTDVIWFNEFFIIMPSGGESEWLKGAIRKRIAGWGLQPGEGGKVKVRVTVAGYTLDKPLVLKTLKEEFSDYTFYDAAGPRTDALNVVYDDQRKVIAEKVHVAIEELKWSDEPSEPDRDMILSSALELIYRD